MRPSIRSNVSRSSTVSSIVRRCVDVVLLDREKVTIYIEGKAKVCDVFNQVCEHLSLRESEYFGLAQLVEEEYHFVDLDSKLQKLLPAEWKATRRVTIGDPQPLTTFYFRVQFYVEHTALLKERTTRHLYYLQLRDNLINFSHLVAEERCFVFAAYALQADYGNCHNVTHSYFDPREYFPAWVLSKHGTEYIRRNMPQMHRDLHGMTKMEAQMHYIKDVSAPPTAHNLHFYQLKKRKADPLGTAWLGICPKGVEIYEELNGFKSVLSTFLWATIAKLYFEKKKFEIRAIGTPDGRKFTYYTGSDERSKYLLSQCETTHLFHMSVLPRLSELRHMEVEDRRFREMYVSGDAHDVSERTSLCRKVSVTSSRSSGSRRGHRQKASPRPACLTQRISVISTASSNTTSGIASDIGKLYTSFEESEDDPGQEIIIDSPPRVGANLTPGHATYPGSYTGSPGVAHGGATIQQAWPYALPQAQYVRATSSPIAPAVSTIPFPFQQQPVARSGSNVSHHGSGRLTAVPTQMRIPSPVAAEARIQRLMFAPMMTVSSAPVAPIKPTVVSGVASTSVTSVRPLNTFVVESVTAPPPQPMMVAQPMTYVTSMPPPPLHDYQVAQSFSAAATSQLQQPQHHAAFQQTVNMQQQVATALPGAYLQPSPSVVAMMMPPPAHRPNTLHTGAVYANDDGYNAVHNEGYNAVHNEGYNAVHNEGYNAVHAPPAMSLPSYDSYRRSSLQNTPQMSPVEPVVSVSPLQRSLPPSPGFSAATALRKMSAPQMSAPSYSVYADVHCDEASTHPLPSDMVVMDTMAPASQNATGSGHQSPGESKAWSDQSATGSPNSEDVPSPPQKTSPVSLPVPAISAVNPECPLHGIQQQCLAAEIRGLNSKNLSLPMLTALCNDNSLSTMCTCYHGDKASQLAAAKKHLSYVDQRRSAGATEAGAMARPVSWHSENFNLDQTLRVFDDVLLSDNDASHASSSSSPSASLSLNNSVNAAVLDRTVIHHTTSSNGSSGGMEMLSNGLIPRFPAKILSGGHSPYNGKAIGPIKASVGIA